MGQGKVFWKIATTWSPFAARIGGQKGKVFGGVFDHPEIPFRVAVLREVRMTAAGFISMVRNRGG
jgi:hypothetical protein